MQIEFASIKSSRELCKRLEDELPLGRTNVSEVLDFLGRERSDVLIRSEPDPPGISRLAKEPYDSYIQYSADAPGERWLWIFSIKFSWYIEFHFLEGNLVEIIAQRYEVAPL